MERRTSSTAAAAPTATAGVAPAAPATQPETAECPICFEMTDPADLEALVHASQADGSAPDRDVSAHIACGTCRESMMKLGQGCPWCRDEVVWKNVFGFLDDLKNGVGEATTPDTLADLMARWEEYELTRSNSDVLLFARDMVQDVALCAHIDRAIAGNAGWLRDSSGLWCRFHAMVTDGELTLGKQIRAHKQYP